MKKILLFLILIVFSAPFIANSTNESIFKLTLENEVMTLSPYFADVTLESCDEDGDGMADFDLASSIPEILAGMNSSDYVVTFHADMDDANAGDNELNTNFLYSSAEGTIYSRIESVADPSIVSVDMVSLMVNKVPITSFANNVFYEVCPNSKDVVDIETSGNNYNRGDVVFRWFKDGVLVADETSSKLRKVGAGFYEVETTFTDTGCSSITSITVEEVQNCIVPQGISPNGDGMNDSLDLTGFRVDNIEIFNRYGTKVFSRANYTNEWSGQTDDGKDLPVGTYFYTLNYKGGQKTSGWVYIQREK